jgi:hypothetical protein
LFVAGLLQPPQLFGSLVRFVQPIVGPQFVWPTAQLHTPVVH